ncbi:hypothetical protein [Cylindrospermum sp. FACHB-282]|uniref:hypothetical protein n=1 Tax=Cylindrospermum sp. FACHB-282 TaxID=2692794 RepID=UPI001688A80F|nr:hypothetical protein [Cylindrospermum sp. FACHB-282]MBD2386014.1 hypothetical protein [Cylindrospermum sp. FACHB-282]
MDLTGDLLTAAIPSLANSIIQIKNLDLVWHGLDAKQKYFELTNKDFSHEEAITFQNNAEHKWSVYAMEDYVVLFLTKEHYIFKAPQETWSYTKRIETQGESLWKFKLNESSKIKPLKAAAIKYQEITGEELSKENAIAYRYDSRYKEAIYQMKNFIVVVSQDRVDAWVCGAYIYWK